MSYSYCVKDTDAKECKTLWIQLHKLTVSYYVSLSPITHPLYPWEPLKCRYLQADILIQDCKVYTGWCLIHSEKLWSSSLLFLLSALSIWYQPPPGFPSFSSPICLSTSSTFSYRSTFTSEEWPILYNASQPGKHILFHAVKQALILIDFINIISGISP